MPAPIAPSGRGGYYSGMTADIARIMRAMIDYDSPDTARINHALKVHGFARLIALSERVSETELFTVEACGLLHDIGIHEAERKHGSSSGNFQEIEGPPIAGKILEASRVPTDTATAERILFIIGNHHSYKNIDGRDFQILVEADFLVNIFEDGMERPEIETLRNKLFKTDTGKSLLETMYLKSGS
jgi:hypothetical protein